jgi:hypothetical protein
MSCLGPCLPVFGPRAHAVQGRRRLVVGATQQHGMSPEYAYAVRQMIYLSVSIIPICVNERLPRVLRRGRLQTGHSCLFQHHSTRDDS